MKSKVLIIIIIVILSGCLEYHIIPSPPPVQQVPQPPPSPEPPPHLRVTQQPTALPTPTITVTPTPIPPPDFYYLNITTMDHNITPFNTTFIIEYPLNRTMTMKCNNTVFYPEVVTATDTNPTVLYIFTVGCSPRTKGILTIDGRTETIFIPRIEETWHIKILHNT